MKKRLIPRFLICLLFALTFLCSCYGVSENISLCIVGSYAVPVMQTWDLTGTERTAKELERDAYGRILFCYEAPSLLTGEKIKAIVISQALDDHDVYYYEDMCYYMGDATEEKTNVLKEQNDWGKPLNSKMARKRAFHVTFDLYFRPSDSGFDQEKAQKTLEEFFELAPGQQLSICGVDTDAANEHELIYCRVSQSDGTGASGYFAIIDPNWSVSAMKINPSDEWNDASAMALNRFKQDSAWVYY